MVHEHAAKPGRNFPALRAAYPDAAIIRRHDTGAYTVFDRVEDAFNHWSATRRTVSA